MKRNIVVIICALSFSVLVGCSSSKESAKIEDTSNDMTEEIQKPDEAHEKEKEAALDDSLEEASEEYIVSSSSPVETLPYDPDAEWNYVPLD